MDDWPAKGALPPLMDGAWEQHQRRPHTRRSSEKARNIFDIFELMARERERRGAVEAVGAVGVAHARVGTRPFPTHLTRAL